jgi:hypothetical protein
MTSIYKSLGYNNFYSSLLPNIIRKDNIKYHEYLINYENNNKEYSLLGGGNRKFTYQGMEFVFEKFQDEDQIHYSLNTIDEIKQCLVIIIAKNENNDMSANINQINFFNSCPHIGHIASKGGSFLLELAKAFINSIKNKYNIKIIQLKDNALKSCTNKNLKLWFFTTLVTGNPWYINHGFEPYNTTELKLDDTNKIKILANYRILYRTNVTVLKEENILDFTDEKLNKLYEKYKNDSVIKFFQVLLKNYKNNCKYIENIQSNIIDKLMLFDITGISYYMLLQKY